MRTLWEQVKVPGCKRDEWFQGVTAALKYGKGVYVVEYGAGNSVVAELYIGNGSYLEGLYKQGYIKATGKTAVGEVVSKAVQGMGKGAIYRLDQVRDGYGVLVGYAVVKPKAFDLMEIMQNQVDRYMVYPAEMVWGKYSQLVDMLCASVYKMNVLGKGERVVTYNMGMLNNLYKWDEPKLEVYEASYKQACESKLFGGTVLKVPVLGSSAGVDGLTSISIFNITGWKEVRICDLDYSGLDAVYTDVDMWYRDEYDRAMKDGSFLEEYQAFMSSEYAGRFRDKYDSFKEKMEKKGKRVTVLSAGTFMLFLDLVGRHELYQYLQSGRSTFKGYKGDKYYYVPSGKLTGVKVPEDINERKKMIEELCKNKLVHIVRAKKSGGSETLIVSNNRRILRRYLNWPGKSYIGMYGTEKDKVELIIKDMKCLYNEKLEAMFVDEETWNKMMGLINLKRDFSYKVFQELGAKRFWEALKAYYEELKAASAARKRPEGQVVVRVINKCSCVDGEVEGYYTSIPLELIKKVYVG